MRRSLRTRLALIIFVALCVPAAVQVQLFPAQLYRESRDAFRDRTIGQAHLVAANLAPALDFDDRAAALRRIAELEALAEAEYALVIDRQGSTIASWVRAGRAVPLRPQLALDSCQFEGALAHAQVPIATRGGADGVLWLGLSFAAAERRAAGAALSAKLTSLALLFGGLLAALVVGTWLVRPLRRATAVAERVAAGDFAAQKDLAGDAARADEAGVLARAMQKMLDRLFRQQRELETSVEALRSAQEQLVLADRRAAVGRLAAGVAHEVNNPLAYILSNLHYALEELGDKAPGDVVTALRDSISGAERVAFVVRALKAAARNDEAGENSVIDLASCVDAAVAITHSDVRHHAKVVKDYQCRPAVMANPIRLGQVFINLLLNASQAMNGRADGEIRVEIRQRDGKAEVCIADNGRGIAAEVKERLFEPFFTTRLGTGGTGLGLSVSLGIVQAYGGAIAVDSEEGDGSSFTVTLPVSDQPPVVMTVTPTPRPGPRMRLLVVDDEELVGNAIRRGLASTHDVHVVVSGEAALEAIKAGPPFDVLLTDLHMSGMSGPQLVEALEKVAPELKRNTLFMTGGAVSEAMHAFALAHEDQLLIKPLSLAQLRAALAKVLQPAARAEQISA